ncbi:MAG: M28 family peptidase [Clostridia bacterium]
MADFNFKKGADDMMAFIKKIESEVGPRLPGSEEERKAAKIIKGEYEKTIGIKPVSEPFKVAPNSGIGAIPYIGIIALISLVLYFIYPLAGAILAALALGYFLVMGGVYTGMFDFLWKQQDSENFYTIQEPTSGKVDFTIITGAHYDSSWNWILQKKNPKTFIPKIVYGIVGVVGIIVGGIILTATGFSAPLWVNLNRISDFTFWQWLAIVFPVVCLPGLYFITQFLSHDKTQASPGCMDNLTGISLNMVVAEHFKNNPDDLPANCRLITTGFGCEEAGLKGSFAFVKKHKNDGLLKNAFCINVDSISDGDYFEVVTADPIQFCKFDKELCDLMHGCLAELNLIKKTGRIVNPIGGCDATPLTRAGVRCVTFAAQNPVPTTYYHTSNDMSDRLSTEVFEGGIAAVYSTIKKIGDLQSKK